MRLVAALTRTLIKPNCNALHALREKDRLKDQHPKLPAKTR
jgi:hypothetical protein